MNNFLKYKNIIKNKKGFTLVELLIVVAIIGILSTISILSLISFQKHQKLLNAVREINSAINLAKSRAQSQVKPASCPDTSRLDGYKLIINPQGSGSCSLGICYQVIPVCNGVDLIAEYPIKFLPSGIAYSGLNSFLFRVINGNVSYNSSNPSSDLVFSNSAESIRITIFKDGRVSLIE